MANEYFLAMQQNPEIRSLSQSGGVSLALITEILRHGGIVYGCCYDQYFVARHYRIEYIEDAHKTCGSKYVQSELGDTFNMIADDLASGVCVLFTGTSCQVSGLLRFLKVKRIEQDNLYTVDIVCHGVPSPIILHDFLAFLQDEKKSELVEVNLRNKKYAPANYATFRFMSGEEIINNGYSDLFYSNLMLRPSCGKCKYASIDKPADITVGDVVQISKKLQSQVDRKDPQSIVITRTSKGKRLLENCCLRMCQINREDFDQVNLHTATRFSPQRDTFWKDYSRRGISFVLNKYTGLGGPLTKIRRKVLQKLDRW